MQWLKDLADTRAVTRHLKMPWLHWESKLPCTPDDGLYNLSPLACVDGPAFILPDPHKIQEQGHFFYESTSVSDEKACIMSAYRAIVGFSYASSDGPDSRNTLL